MTEARTILVTGGAGYIGSHTCVLLLEAGHRVVVLDNLSNSKRESLSRVEELTGRAIHFHEADLRDRADVEELFAREPVDAVIHFAGLKAVEESMREPLAYYQNNVGGTANLLDGMSRRGVKEVVFSSSCTVYGAPEQLPIREDSPLCAVNPYGQSKLTVELMLRDLSNADPDWAISVLRYFNPVGAHPSGRIGEDPTGIPNNLMPYVTQVAAGRLERLQVFGGDYDTPDGTCIRDYIHVMDVAQAHLAALDHIAGRAGRFVHNIGTGRGHSVLEVVQGFERATGQRIPRDIVGRRAGDAPAVFADASRSQTELGWRARHDLDAMCRDAWNWQNRNPRGYA